MPLELHNGFFVRANQLLALLFLLQVPKEHRGVVGAADAETVGGHYLADASSTFSDICY